MRKMTESNPERRYNSATPGGEDKPPDPGLVDSDPQGDRKKIVPLQQELDISQKSDTISRLCPRVENVKRQDEDSISTHDRNFSYFDNAPVSFLVLTHQGLIQEINVVGTFLLGRGKPEIIQTPFVEFVETTQRKRWDQYFKTIVQEKDTQICDISLIRDDGTPIYARVHGIKQSNPSHEIFVILLLTDISELKRTEETLRENEKRLYLLFQNSPYPYQSLDVDGCILDVNETWLEVLGYERSEVIGQPFMGFLHSSCQTPFVQNFPVFVQTGYAHEVEFLMVCKNGTEILVSFEGKVGLNEDGSFRQTHCIFQDITKRHEDETRIIEANRYHRGLIETSIDPFVTISPIGRITDVNSATEKVTGLSRDQLIGTDFSDYFTEPQKAREGYLFVLHNGTIHDYPLSILHRGGTITPVLYNASTYYDKDGAIQGVFAIARDITGLKQAEEALSETNQKLRLLTGITRHDILNTMASVRAFHYLALNETNLDEIHELISRANKAAIKIETAIGFTRQYDSFGNAPCRWQPIVHIIEAARWEVSLENVRLDIQIPENQEIYADPVIQKVFTTLLENSIRHGEQVTHIRISLSEHLGDRIIHYQDDGVGISDEEKDHIFDKGYGRNTGLGLFLAKEILSITGLSICESGSPGYGAHFEITVPALKYRQGGNDGDRNS